MASFYWKVYSGESLLNQWESHIQNQMYIDDIKGSLKNQTNDFGKIINTIAEKDRATFNMFAQNICGSLENGFQTLTESINNNTYEISGQIEHGFKELSSDLFNLDTTLREIRDTLEIGFSAMVDEQRISNVLAQKTILHLKIPDFQKERQYYIKQGLKFLDGARNTDQEYYDDALINFEKAKELEDTDYFVLYRLGLIYMFSPKHLDIDRAQRYFLKAAKYAAVESNLDSIKFAEVISESIGSTDDFNQLKKDKKSIKKITAQCLTQAAIGAYLNENFQNSLKYLIQAKNLNSKDPRVLIQLIKTYLALERSQEAAKYFKILLKTKPQFSLAFVNELDLAVNSEIQLALKELKNELQDKIHELKLKWGNLNKNIKEKYSFQNLGNKYSDSLSKLNKFNDSVSVLLLKSDFLSLVKTKEKFVEIINLQKNLIEERKKQISQQQYQNDKKKIEEIYILRKKINEKLKDVELKIKNNNLGKKRKEIESLFRNIKEDIKKGGVADLELNQQHLKDLIGLEKKTWDYAGHLNDRRKRRQANIRLIKWIPLFIIGIVVGGFAGLAIFSIIEFIASFFMDVGDHAVIQKIGGIIGAIIGYYYIKGEFNL